MRESNSCTTGRRSSAAAVAGALALGFTVPAAHATDLVRAYETARLHDSTLAAAEAAYRAAAEVLPQAKAGLGPSVQGSAAVNQVASQARSASSESGSTAAASIGATQPLYRPAASLAVKQAEARMPALEAQLRKVQQGLILRVSQAYFSVLQALDTLEATSSQKESLQAQRDQAVRAMQIGTGNLIEEAEASSRFDLIVATELQALGSYRVARRALEQITGETTSGLARLAPLDLTQLASGDEGYWLSTADGRSPEVQQAEAQLAAQKYEIELAKAAWWPTVDLVAGITQTYSTQRNLDLSRTDGRSASVGVTMSVPIWEPGLRDSRLRQSLALVDQSQGELVTARRDTALAVKQAMTTLTTNAAQAKALAQAVQSSQVSLQASQRGREIGSRTSLDVLNARQQLYQAKTQLAGSRYAAVLALLQLKAAAGVLAEADLKALTDPRSEAPLIGPSGVPMSPPVASVVR